MQVYIKDKKALAYFHKEANPQFWDEHWQMDSLRDHILSSTSGGIFFSVVKKYLPVGSTVLEGGCGRAHLVHALDYQGYKAIGVDFARETVRKINEAVPGLDVRFGDVRNLPIANSELDGYLSLGVIEHYWEGYRGILAEMRRTIKNGGFLFISFPQISALRQLKVKTRIYSVSSSQQLEDHSGNFYQFAFNWRQVSQDLQTFGFRLIERWPFDGIKGLKDEVTFLKPLLQPIYDGKRHQRLKIYLDKILRKFTSHCHLLVMQKI
jgi:SAM-dependent methyltransferase